MRMKRIDLIQVGGFAPTQNLVTAEVPVPQPQPNELRVDVKASAINPVDWKMAEYGFLLPDPLPASLGCDCAGVVTAGDASWIGKRVLLHVGANKASTGTTRGAYVDQVCSEEDVVFEIPETMSFAQAVSLPVGGMTALEMLNRLENVEQDDWVLVWGASSSVGWHGVQLAQKRGFKVIAVASGKHKEALQSVGAAAFVDYRQDNVEEKVREIVGDSGTLNGALDCIGVAESFSTSAKLVDQLGRKDGKTKVVGCVNSGMPEPPPGVVCKSVVLAAYLEAPDTRKLVIDAFPQVLKLKPQNIRSVQGPMAAETLQKAFQISKDGVSGEKVVIEWTK